LTAAATAGVLVAATVLAVAVASAALGDAPARARIARLHGPTPDRPASRLAGVAQRASRARRDRQADAALPAALESMARSLRSGATLGHAIAEAAAATPGEVGADLARVADHAVGAGLVTAIDAWARGRPAAPNVRLAATALILAADTGGAAAAAVDGLAATLRQRLAAAAEVRSLATQARLSAAVIGAAPAAFAATSSAADHRAGRFLLATPAGLACLAAGVALDVTGLLWMAHITRGAA
jgi:tight adherence protein B